MTKHSHKERWAHIADDAALQREADNAQNWANRLQRDAAYEQEKADSMRKELRRRKREGEQA